MREVDLCEKARHFAEEIKRLAVRLPEFDAQCLMGGHRSLNEPTVSVRISGFIRIIDNLFSVRNIYSGE